MKNILTVYIFFMSVMLSMITSCATSPEKKIDSMYLMVYDYDNSEVMNVAVYMDDKLAGETDIYGRLLIPCDGQKKVIIKTEKKGYESLETEEIIKPGILLYFKIGSGSYYAEKAERFLDENNLDQALKMIKQALKIEDRKDWRFLQEVITKENRIEE